jgi:hypothetical protein
METRLYPSDVSELVNYMSCELSNVALRGTGIVHSSESMKLVATCIHYCMNVQSKINDLGRKIDHVIERQPLDKLYTLNEELDELIVMCRTAHNAIQASTEVDEVEGYGPEEARFAFVSVVELHSEMLLRMQGVYGLVCSIWSMALEGIIAY